MGNPRFRINQATDEMREVIREGRAKGQDWITLGKKLEISWMSARRIAVMMGLPTRSPLTRKPRSRTKRKQRTCLYCGRKFMSAGNFKCESCNKRHASVVDFGAMYETRPFAANALRGRE